MKRHWIEDTESRTHGPMPPWVHIPSQADPTRLNPFAPAWIQGKGYPVYYIEIDGFTIQSAQYQHDIAKLKRLVQWQRLGLSLTKRNWSACRP